ncbi:malonate decarboxylase holo-ACP synthase [Alkalihalophilus lindianensis]|uniref:Malonate decarboxylase holo-ACP synthase n=1 Tax=Alkalihalophilus lindianensis TaxID=1630542 RepID=A0ABU3XDK0_9BACI|nr:malonate decarboxylase holo-ACP synthase [Alkalihalophilus lindianensis]MDV2685965.1 malonate decarboxylase holo-ACP synthase [Alkalihalophilus lindianensis]
MVRVHDLIELTNVEGFLLKGTFPDWVRQSLRELPYVVVRRAPIIDGLIPIGIRGKHRSERCASTISISSIKKIYTPESIDVSKVQTHTPPIKEALKAIEEMMAEYPLTWGPTGSVGFELITRNPTTHLKSDIDMIIRSDVTLQRTTAETLINQLSKLPVKVDILLERDEGGYALSEYASGAKKLVMRSTEGPKLVTHPVLQLLHDGGKYDDHTGT